MACRKNMAHDGDAHLKTANIAFGAIRDEYVAGFEAHALVQPFTDCFPQWTFALLCSIAAHKETMNQTLL